MPLCDSAVDRALLVHALEVARDPIALLRVGVARLGRGRAAVDRGAEPARRLGAPRYDAVRPWPALFALADHAAPARDLVHRPDGWEDALHVPPVARGWFLRSAVALGRAPAPLSPCRSRACTSSRRRSRSIAPSRRGARGRGSCLRSSPRSCLRQGASCYRRRSSSRDQLGRLCDQSPRAGSSPPSPPPCMSGRGPRWRRRRRCSGKRSPWRSWPFWLCCEPWGGWCCCPPVMKDGKRSTLASVGAWPCGGLVRLALLMLREKVAHRAGYRVAARACRKANGRSRSSTSAHRPRRRQSCLRAPPAPAPAASFSGREKWGLFWRNCSCAAAITR